MGLELLGKGLVSVRLERLERLKRLLICLMQVPIRTCIGHEHPLHMRMPISALRSSLFIETLGGLIPVRHPIPLHRQTFSPASAR